MTQTHAAADAKLATLPGGADPAADVDALRSFFGRNCASDAATEFEFDLTFLFADSRKALFLSALFARRSASICSATDEDGSIRSSLQLQNEEEDNTKRVKCLKTV